MMKIEIKLKGEMRIMIEVTYKQMGDYQVPQVALPKTKNLPQGKYSRMRLTYLKEHKKGLYTGKHKQGLRCDSRGNRRTRNTGGGENTNAG